MYTFEYYIRSPLNRPIHLPYRPKPVGQLHGFHLNNRHARIINIITTRVGRVYYYLFCVDRVDSPHCSKFDGCGA